MIVVPIKEGENIERALKKFKRKFEKTGVTKELRRRQQFDKPSVTKRLAMEHAIYVQKLRRNEESFKQRGIIQKEKSSVGYRCSDGMLSTKGRQVGQPVKAECFSKSIASSSIAKYAGSDAFFAQAVRPERVVCFWVV